MMNEVSEEIKTYELHCSSKQLIKEILNNKLVNNRPLKKLLKFTTN